MLKEAFEEVVALQKRYSSLPAKSPEMIRRGVLIRDEIPNLLRKHVAHGFSVEGRDGMGRPSRVPYCRVFEKRLSSKAGEGTYAVFLFAADGSALFLSLNQATSERVDHTPRYRSIPPNIVSARGQEERLRLHQRNCDLSNLAELISLKDPDAGARYENGNIYSLRYDADSVPRDATIYADITRILSLLKVLDPNATPEPTPAGVSTGALPPAPLSSQNVSSQNVFRFFSKAWSATPTSALASLTGAEREIVLEHNKMQGALYTRLVEHFGKEHVRCENSTGFETRIDVVVRQENRYRFYEIKTDLLPRVCLRQAIGQLLEYAFFGSGRPDEVQLIVVGKTPIDKASQEYLDLLKKRFNLSIEYETVEAGARPPV